MYGACTCTYLPVTWLRIDIPLLVLQFLASLAVSHPSTDVKLGSERVRASVPVSFPPLQTHRETRALQTWKTINKKIDAVRTAVQKIHSKSIRIYCCHQSGEWWVVRSYSVFFVSPARFSVISLLLFILLLPFFPLYPLQECVISRRTV